MPIYKIHRMRDSQRQQFRWAPHTAGLAQVKPKDFEDGGAMEAPSPYSAWAALRSGDNPLQVGDVLESEDGRLFIYKYVGFEDARWLLPEVRSGLESIPPASGPSSLQA